MLKLSLLEFFLRLIPETCILVLSAYAFSGKNIDKINFCISTILLSIATYLVRMLPIHFGVHTIILLIIYVLITININKIDIIKAVSAGLTSATILFICEWINVFIITSLFKVNAESAFKNAFLKVIYGIPSLLLFAIIIFAIWSRNSYSRKAGTNVSNREVIK
ncbi:hypothetical protein P8V03_13720 [Clostridium sp. A1-XYC3]|uniref:Uncharacterized protein n=1 Tax=Clostridium tanneri TaxID=3037988 RepID=A0ABU4JWA0_9CLOT|nr:hypothetical protein [Clostridium sp. A1-XYC3]MDW8802208.1 hypothetical protein [Clostridium sp. A1-XYC3]